MNIAIFGSTSQIAKDLILSFYSFTSYKLVLFSRGTERVENWLKDCKIQSYDTRDYSEFKMSDTYDVIINFVGVGNPATAKQMGSSIFDITYHYDKLALDYLEVHPGTKYIFLSSGAVFGGNFEQYVTEQSVAIVDVNRLQDNDWYGISKLYAEARHRALKDQAIVDIRVFNYFCHTQDMNARFLITDIVRAIQDQEILKTSADNIVRDFTTPVDFYQLVNCIIKAEPINMPVDCYTKAPIDKLNLLSVLSEKFGLQYELVTSAGMNSTGRKLNYYSMNRAAEKLGFKPTLNSLDAVLNEINTFIEYIDV